MNKGERWFRNRKERKGSEIGGREMVQKYEGERWFRNRSERDGSETGGRDGLKLGGRDGSE